MGTSKGKVLRLQTVFVPTAVDRQMKRYKVPRVAFINKLDRLAARPMKVLRAGLHSSFDSEC